MSEAEKDDDKPKIVFKRHSNHEAHAHHGGAWKIAYADFVTAMMAFFLVMWLLASIGKYDLEGISEYFNRPISAVFSDTGSSSSVLQGGGPDAVQNKGQIRKGDPVDPKNRMKVSERDKSKEEQKEKEKKKFEEISKKFKESIEKNQELQKIADQIKIDVTQEGLRIQIVDDKNRPMFESGSATLQPYTATLLRELSKIIKDMPNGLSISGHTDSVPYPGSGRGYSNWELSADRANAARRELTQTGVPIERMRRVVGLADTTHINKDPNNPENRRIAIVLMTAEAEEEMKIREQPSVDIAPDNLPTNAASLKRP